MSTDLPQAVPAIPRVPISRYRFTLRADTPFRLTGYPGAMLRGAWGHALRQLACSAQREQCSGCAIRSGCRYTSLFEPLPDVTESGTRDIPPPYIFEAPLAQPRQLSPGDTWSFDMVLFGGALSDLPLIIWAWQEAAQAGLGEQNAPMTLLLVAHEQAPSVWQSVWQASVGGRLGSTLPRLVAHRPELTVPPTIGSKPAFIGAKLALLTPTRLQVKGHICAPEQITAPMLLQTLWRKLALYLHHYTAITLPEMPTTEGILLHSHSLTRQRWARHSNRQQKAMRLDGVTGELTLHGRLEAWWPWLWLGQYTHVGKNTSFGLGQYHLSVLD